MFSERVSSRFETRASPVHGPIDGTDGAPGLRKSVSHGECSMGLFYSSRIDAHVSFQSYLKCAVSANFTDKFYFTMWFEVRYDAREVSHAIFNSGPLS